MTEHCERYFCTQAYGCECPCSGCQKVRSAAKVRVEMDKHREQYLRQQRQGHHPSFDIKDLK